MKKIKLKVIFQNSLYHVKFQLLTSVFPVQIMLKSSNTTCSNQHDFGLVWHTNENNMT